MTIDITKIVVTLVGILFTVITTYAVPCIKAQLKNEKIKTVVEIATMVVKSAHELKITGELEEIGLTKSEYALAEAKKALAEKNIIVNDEELTMFIKAQVAELRTEIEW